MEYLNKGLFVLRPNETRQQDTQASLLHDNVLMGQFSVYGPLHVLDVYWGFKEVHSINVLFGYLLFINISGTLPRRELIEVV